MTRQIEEVPAQRSRYVTLTKEALAQVPLIPPERVAELLRCGRAQRDAVETSLSGAYHRSNLLIR